MMIKSNAQQTPETAQLFTSLDNAGTMVHLYDTSFGSPTSGVNFGNLSSASRIAWTFIPKCDSAQVKIDLYSLNGSDTMGYAIYGPFNDTTQILNKLQSTTPAFSIWPNTTVFNSIYLPTAPGIYYVAWYLSSFTGFKTIRASITDPQSTHNLCGYCNNAFKIYQTICLITLDSTTQRNQLIWDIGDTANLEGFILYRENSIANHYDSLTFIHRDSANYYIDMSANPATRNWRYIMQRYDRCGYILDPYYTNGGYLFRYNTLHLQQGISTNNSINLSWNNSINNVPIPGYGLFVQSFFIYRSNGQGPFQCIDSVPSSVGSYTDVNPSQGLNLYQVGVRKINPCNIVRSSNGESMSNMISTTFTGLHNPTNHRFFDVYPNPAKSVVTVDLNQSATDWHLELTSPDGRIVFQTSGRDGGKTSIDIGSLSGGIYVVKVSSDGKEYFKRLVIN